MAVLKRRNSQRDAVKLLNLDLQKRWGTFSSYENFKHENVIHLLLHERIGQCVQRLVRASPRTKTTREAKKVLLVNLIEDGNHSLLDDFVLQRCNPDRNEERCLSGLKKTGAPGLLKAFR